MARPQKKGLDYFPLDTDFFSNPKIKILKARYGVDGISIYIYLLCQIYQNGYYIEFNEDFQYIMSDDLNMGIDKVKQVLKFLLERSLFDNKLFQSDTILTSAGIQRRFQLAVKERARKNQVEVGRFWLLDEKETEPFIKCTLFSENTGKTNGYSGKNSSNSTEQSLKKSKVKNNISIYDAAFSNQELKSAFQLYVMCREQNGEKLSNDQVQLLIEDLKRITAKVEEQIAIVKKATVSNWKSFYPISGKRPGNNKSAQKPIKNKFNNFEGRKYDYDSLEQQLLNS